MPLSTKDYLTEKKALQENIDYYRDLIPKLRDQLHIKQNRLLDFEQKLHKLEKVYYTNGI